jgi:hypothetical protein
MSATGRWLCVADGLAEGLADGVGETAVGSVVAEAETRGVLRAAGTAMSVTGVSPLDTAAAVGAVTREVRAAAGLTDAVSCLVLDTLGVAACVAARMEGTWLVAAGLEGVTVTMGDAWPSPGAVGCLCGTALAVGVT